MTSQRFIDQNDRRRSLGVGGREWSAVDQPELNGAEILRRDQHVLRVELLAWILHVARRGDAIAHRPAAERQMTDRSGVANSGNRVEPFKNGRVKGAGGFRSSVTRAVGKKMKREKIVRLKTEICFLEAPQTAP